MDNSIPPQNDGNALGLPNVAPNPTSQQVPTSNGSVDPEAPVKRRPGRPKGSTKKNLLGGPQLPPKAKRPVGRPRKDGLPAGSVGSSRRAKRERAPTAWPTNISGVGYPPMPMLFGNSISANATTSSIQIDPSLDKDEWVNLARTNSNAFLATLLTALAAPNPVSSAGPSVEEAFKSHLVSLAPVPSQAQPIPSLYSILKTFWLPCSPAYFSLTASASTARTPSEHRFLYWDPQPLVFNGIYCPNCSAPLQNKGRISTGPIKIYDIEKPFFIVGCEYVCRSPQCISVTSPEGRKFASTDASILRSLPTKLKDEFPARLMYSDTDAGSGPNIWNWKALGVSLSLWNMVHGCLQAGLKKEIILHIIHSIQFGVPQDYNDEDSGEEDDADGDVNEGDAGPQQEGPPPNNSGPPQGPAPGPPPAPPPGLNGEPNPGSNGFTEAYSAAWKAHTAVGDSNASKTPGTQGSAESTTQSTGPPQTYDYTKAFQYATFFPGTLVGGTVVPMQAGVVTSPPHMPSNNLSSVSSLPGVLGAEDAGHDLQAKRSPRHCCKCGSQDCKGKGGRAFCTNACQDCGQLDCKGRNSRRPDKKCSEGWV